MKNWTLLSLSFLFSLYLSAQKPPIKWGDIPMEDLKMTVYEQDPDAGAVVLGNYVDVVFNINEDNIVVEYRYHKRIKILKETGLEEADIRLAYSDSEEIIALNAQVFNLVDGKSKKLKLTKEKFFKQEESESLNSIKFAFPEVKVGSIIEYKYTFKDNHLVVLEPWYFQEAIPTRWSEFRIVVPEDFVYTIIKGGTLPFFIDESIKVNNLQINAASKKHAGQGAYFSSEPSELRGTNQRKVVKDAPAIVEADFSTTMRDYYTKVAYQLKSIEQNGMKRTYFTTWEAIASELRTRDKFGVQIKNAVANKKLTDLVPSAIEGASTDMEKAAKVFELVSNSIKWNQRYGVMANQTINKATSLSLGNSAAINLGLVASLNKAGINADPVLISTRSHGKPQPLYPLLSQFNHVIAVADIDGKRVFMDAINPNRPFNVLAINDLNGIGCRVNKEEGGITEWVEITPTKGVTNSNLTIEVRDNKFTGHVVNSHMGYAAVSARENYLESGEEDYLFSCLGEELEYTVEKANFKGNKSNSNRFVEDLHVTFDDMTLADKIYLNPLLLSSQTENPFKLKTRNYPVDIAYPIAETFSCKFMIPEGYEVVELPESIKLKIPDGTASYHYFIEQTGNSINVLSKLKLSKIVYSPEEYTTLKQLFEKVIEKQAEQVVLQKS